MAADASMLNIYVQPGESRLITEPGIMCTILGSCVGVAFLSQRHGVAALCHPMLPELPEKCASTMSPKEARRYVDFAIRDIASQLDARGISRREVTVKLFGGADVLPMMQSATQLTVGQLNCAVAQRVLREEGFAIAASRLGGTSGLQIRFHTDTGEVLLRKLD